MAQGLYNHSTIPLNDEEYDEEEEQKSPKKSSNSEANKN
ncbi:hypothetical protein B4U79_11519 [Dinothrombium tinctorium]|uniref:Homeobox engrailed C-terminal domain-containing protein n=1 Tax=Dinothrombium tinctorium TaxID=1965070 RepID=A0A3S3S5X6_9ACAR|nr:hypothetical protein B4U79_11519 [Dinothrombium tinctorium]